MHYDEQLNNQREIMNSTEEQEFEKAIQEASVNIRNEYKSKSIHIKTEEDAEAYINKMKIDYLVGDLSEETLLEGINGHKAYADLVNDPWHPFFEDIDDDDFDGWLEDIRHPDKPRAAFKNGEWVLK